MCEDEQLLLCMNEQTMEGCELECVSVLHRRVGKNVFLREECILVIIFPQREVQSAAEVWVWAWTDNPATLHSQP